MLSASFLEFIKKEKLFDHNQHLLLAISGGLDSVVLAHLLKRNDFRFSMAHMNFQLRGEDSNKDEEFVRDLAQQLEVEVYVKKVEIDKKAGSTQVQARDLRYTWFDELQKKHSFDKLLTAHHANDLLETALHNFSRGSGIKGLRGILPLQNLIARPLLFSKKSELEIYAKEHSINWREDISNESDHYTRNKIRHNIVPQFLKLNPNLLSGFQLTALRLRATETAWEEKLKQISDTFLKFTDQEIEVDKVILNDPYAMVYLSDLLIDYGFTLQRLQSFDFSRIGAQLFSGSHVLVVDRVKIIISKLNEDDHLNSFPRPFSISENFVETPFGNIKLEIIDQEVVQFERKPNVVFVDLETIKEPLEIDIWHEGDKIQPFGMKGKKKISDILIDQKVSLPKKRKVMVLKSKGEIFWVIGHKFSEVFKVKEGTKKILRIEYHENS